MFTKFTNFFNSQAGKTAFSALKALLTSVGTAAVTEATKSAVGNLPLPDIVASFIKSTAKSHEREESLSNISKSYKKVVMHGKLGLLKRHSYELGSCHLDSTPQPQEAELVKDLLYRSRMSMAKPVIEKAAACCEQRDSSKKTQQLAQSSATLDATSLVTSEVGKNSALPSQANYSGPISPEKTEQFPETNIKRGGKPRQLRATLVNTNVKKVARSSESASFGRCISRNAGRLPRKRQEVDPEQEYGEYPPQEIRKRHMGKG